MACHCSGVGSKANWNACSVQPSGAAYLRAIVLERGHRPGRTMGGGTPAVEPGAEAGQDLGHVSDQVIVCSTTMVVTVGSRSRARNFRREPHEAGLVGTPPTLSVQG